MENFEELSYEVYQDAVKCGILNPISIQAKCEDMRRKEALAKHKYAIWQAKNGNWYTYLPDSSKPNKRRQIYRKIKRELEDAIVDFYRQEEENPTLESVFREWEDRRIELGQIALSTRSRDERYYKRHLSAWGDRRMKEIAPMEFVDFLEKEAADKKLTNKDFNNLKGIVRGFLKRAKRRGIISYSVEETLEVLELPRGGYKKRKKTDAEEVYNEEEVERIVAYLQEHLDSTNLGLLIVFLTGVRIGELVALNHNDFNGDCTFDVNKTETIYEDENGKTIHAVKETPKTDAGDRTVVIPRDYAWIEEEIRLINPSGEAIFLDTKNKRATAGHFRSRLRTICRNLDMPYRSPHKIRKTYGSILLDNKVNEKVITSQMGHTNISCTETFYHKDRTTQEQRIDIISNVPELCVH